MRDTVNCRKAATYLLTFVAATTWLVGACLSTETFAQQTPGTIVQPAKTPVKKDTPTSLRKPHRLIQNPQDPRAASVEPLPPTTAGPSSVTTPPSEIQQSSPTPSKEASFKNTGSLSSVAPLATMRVAPSSATATGSIATPGTANSSTSEHRGGGGRTMQRLVAEMPGLAQLIAPPSAPTLSVNPAIGTSPTSLTFTATQGDVNPAVQTLSISNTGGGTLTWSASGNAPWMTLSPASGSGNGAVTLTVTSGTLPTGSYGGAITLSANGAPTVTVPVSFTVTAAPVPPVIGASPTSLSFTAQQGGNNPATQAFTISNAGGGTLTWSASATPSWLTVSPASGTGTGTVTVSVTTGALSAGTQTGAIMLSAPQATTVSVPVTFTVTAAPATPTIGLSPTTFSFTATQSAANPTSQTLNITNPGTGTLTWSLTDNANWLTLAPTSGTTTTGTNTVTLSVNTLGLLAGPFSATITVTATGATNTPQTIPVTLNLSAPTTSSVTISWNANTEPDLASYKIYISTIQGVYGAPVATVQKPTTTYLATGLNVGNTYYFTVTAVDSSGNESSHSNEVSKSIL